MWIVVLMAVFCLLIGLFPWAFAMLDAPGPNIAPAAALRIYSLGVGTGLLLPAYLAIFVSRQEFWERKARAHQHGASRLPAWAMLLLLVTMLPVSILMVRNPSVTFAVVPAGGSLILGFVLVLRFKYGDAG